MSSNSVHQLLPAVHRLRDAERGDPLADILSVIGEQVDLVSHSIEDQYDDLFVETCSPWVVPYLGDLVGINSGMTDLGELKTSRQIAASRLLYPRSQVADAISFERRKGTLDVLEDIAASTASWPARAVEYYASVNTFQSSISIDASMGRTVNVRARDEIERADTAFDELSHAVDARTRNRKSDGLHVREFKPSGLYHPDHVGLHLWRLNCFHVLRGLTRCCCTKPVGDWELRLHTFDSLGVRTPLSIAPTRNADDDPDPFGRNIRGALARLELETDDGRVSERYYGRDRSIEIWTRDGDRPANYVAANRIRVLDLSWLLDECCNAELPKDCELKRSTFVNDWLLPGKAPKGVPTIAIDAEHGLLAYAARAEDLQRFEVLATYYRCFSAEMGGGSYRRPEKPRIRSALKIRRRIRKTDVTTKSIVDLVGDGVFSSPDAGESQRLEAQHLVVEIFDSDSYQLGTRQFFIPDGKHLEIRAARECNPSIVLCDADSCVPTLVIRLGIGARLTLDGIRALNGNVAVHEIDEASPASERQAACATDPSINEPAVQQSRVEINHCTLLPVSTCDGGGCKGSGKVGIDFYASNSRLAVRQSIVGPIRVSADDTSRPVRVSIDDSIVDGQDADCGMAITGATGSVLRVRRSTVIGKTRTQELYLASDTIFTGSVEVERMQVGGMRFCYVPPNRLKPKAEWNTPQQYYCQPSQRIQRELFPYTVTAQAEKADLLRPVFNSTSFGDSDYCQLALACPSEIREGAEDGSEMGVFHDLFQPQRVAALIRRIEEFSPLSLRTSLIFVN